MVYDLKDFQEGGRKIRRVTLLGMLVNFFLLVLKLIGGLIFNSMGLIADALHTLSDIITDFIVVIGSKISSQPADSGHQFGHGKFETLSALILALILIFVGYRVAWESASSLNRQEFIIPGYQALLIGMLSVILKEIMYQVTIKTAKRLDSTALYSNAWHHRSDALSSVVVIAGIISVTFGFQAGDIIAGIVVGLMVIVIGSRILFQVASELLEGTVDEGVRQSVKSTLDAIDDVHSWHQLRTRKVGRQYFIDVHILVSPDLSVTDGHRIAEEVEAVVKEAISKPVNVLTHVEPDHPEERRIASSDI